MSYVILFNKNSIAYYFENYADYERHDIAMFDQFSWEGDKNTPHILYADIRHPNDVQAMFTFPLTINGVPERYAFSSKSNRVNVEVPFTLYEEKLNIGVSVISFIRSLRSIELKTNNSGMILSCVAYDIDYIRNNMSKLILDNSGRNFHFVILLLYADSIVEYIKTRYNVSDSHMQNVKDMISNAINKSCDVIVAKINDIINSYSSTLMSFAKDVYNEDNNVTINDFIEKLAGAVIDANFYCSEERWCFVDGQDRKTFMPLFKNSSRDVVFDNHVDRYPQLGSMRINTASELICSDCTVVPKSIMAGMLYTAFTQSSIVYMTKEKEFRVRLNLSNYMLVQSTSIFDEIYESDFTDTLNRYIRYGFAHAILYHSYNFNPKLREVLSYVFIRPDMIELSWTEEKGVLIGVCKFDVADLGVHFTKEKVDLL